MILSDPEFSAALLTSVMLAGVTSVVAIAIALLAALAIAATAPRLTVLIEAFLLSPMVVPHVVIGIGVLQIYIIYGLRADLMTLTTGHLIVTVPFALRLLLASIAGLDRRVEMAAASLGAPPFAVFHSVVLPQMKMGIAGALVAAFILSFDDVSLTIFLVQPGYTTIPILLFNQAENNPGPGDSCGERHPAACVVDRDLSDRPVDGLRAPGLRESQVNGIGRRQDDAPLSFRTSGLSTRMGVPFRYIRTFSTVSW